MGDDDAKSAKGGEREKRNTVRGYGPEKSASAVDGAASPLEPEQVRLSDDRDADGVSMTASPQEKRVARRGQPAVDIDLIHERRTAPLPDHDWTFVEIWTRNTIYALDARLVCIAVVDQHNRRTHPEHALLGARLVGGQRRDGDSMELSHPFPRPGSEAVFEQSKGRQVRFSQTSSVTRVVLRLRVLTVASDNILPTWEEITGRHEVPVAVRRKNED